MQLRQGSRSVLSSAQHLALLSFLFLFVLAVSFPIISFGMMYVEQPELYLANQRIISWHDLLNVYLHPVALNIFYIPFFRPSGHFLIYKLIMPFIGWHNTKGLLAVNLFFLALSGYVMIQLYALLFPRYKIGAYIAFSIYLMHPALMLSRLTIMHFEFAYVFFVLSSLYYFLRFCQQQAVTADKIHFTHSHLLASAILLYIIAVTFKEPAIVLGPLLAICFLLSLYRRQPLFEFVNQLFRNKQICQILFLISVVSITLGIYLALSLTGVRTLDSVPTLQAIWASVNEFLKVTFCLQKSIFASDYMLPQTVWRHVVNPYYTTVLMCSLLVITGASTFCLLHNPIDKADRDDQKSLGILYFAMAIFLILPIIWARAFPWHFSLPLLFLSLIIGFSVEYLCRAFITHKIGVYVLGGCLAIAIGLTAIKVNQMNIDYEMQTQGFALTLARNAVMHPPPIKAQLHADSLIVIEDSTFDDGYRLGNLYPLPFLLKLGTYDFNKMESIQANSFFKFRSIEAGTFFKLAYLMPTLKEEIVPFQVNKMGKLPNVVIYDWLQQGQDIFCFGYDKKASWHECTTEFKVNLAREKADRHLIVNAYKHLAATALLGHAIAMLNLPFPDFHLCQLQCDQDKRCSGFTYINAEKKGDGIRKCNLYDSALSALNQRHCEACTGFIKIKSGYG